MHDFVRKLKTELRLLDIDYRGPIVVGLSGGADSVALTAALHQLKETRKLDQALIIGHFNHGLRAEESDADEAHCKSLAKSFELEFISGKAGENEIRGNIEQSARQSRYSFLCETADKAGSNTIFTAHTVNDQAETFLLNLIRGSGTEGLSAMPVGRELDKSGIRLIRPMLSWAFRASSTEFCREMGIDFRTDSMNDDLDYKRVRIRKELLPVLQQYNPSIIETLARTAATMNETCNAVEQLLSTNMLTAELIKSDTIALKSLKSLPDDLVLPVLKSWLRNQRGDLRAVSKAHLVGILALVRSEKSGRIVELPGEKIVVKGSGKLELKDREVEKSTTEVYN